MCARAKTRLPRRLNLLLACAALLVAPSPARAAADTELSESELLAIARHAPPAPAPAFGDPGGHIDDDAARRVHSALTGYGRALGVPGAADGDPAPDLPPSGGAAGVRGTARPAELEPTRPAPVYDTMARPWDMVAKLLVRFRVDDRSYYYGCSGVLIGPFHLATAGHCVFSWDPNGDGSPDDAAWADDVWVWPAQTDQLQPLGVPERPFGEARSVLNRAYEGWTQGADIGWDLAVATLNRRIGDAVGWMPIEVDQAATGLSFSGYPIERPYVPANTLLQYAGMGVDNVVQYGTRQVELSIYSYGGQSGGPVWRSDGPDDYHLQAVQSVSDRKGRAAAALVTSAAAGDFTGWMAADAAARMPTPRPDLCEYVQAPDAKGLLATSIRQEENLPVLFNVYNSGAAPSGAVAVDFYLSNDTSITDQDTFVGRQVLDSLGADAHLVASTDLTVPAAVPTGDYYVGWLMRAMEPEYSTANNSAVIGDRTLHVARAFTPTSTPTATPSAAPTATEAEIETTPTALVTACLGDCRGDRQVTVDDLVLMVTIGLGMAPVDQCINGDADGDGEVSIAEVIASVRHALDGCA